MYKKTITFTGFDGKKKKEDHYFNLMRSELVELEATTDGGLMETLERIQKEKKAADIIEMVKKFILASHGVKEDDSTFRKTKETRDAFEHSLAYDALFMELLENEDEAVKFFKSIIPEMPKSESEHPAKKAKK